MTSYTRELVDFEACRFVFVYGTLKTQHGNNRLLNWSTFQGVATTEKQYVLLDHGIPFLIHDSEVEDTGLLKQVRGEVWELDDEYDLAALDSLESHPNWYYRSLIPTSLGTAWVYFMPDMKIDTNDLCPVVDGSYEWEPNYVKQETKVYA